MRRGKCQVLQDEACEAGADCPKNIACQVGESTKGHQERLDTHYGL
jgi:hypothetical protein